MSVFADLVMRGCSYANAMEAQKIEHCSDGDMEECIEEEQAIDGDELYLEEDGSVGHGAYEQGRGVKIIEQDYAGDALTWSGHDHWDDC